ncbi:S46 family peptidase [Ursidibacter sp. B-7004-1]
MKLQSKIFTFKLKYPTLKKTLALALFSSYSLVSYAQEGMWVPQQLPEISNALKQAGLKLPPEQLTQLTGDPLGAVLSLGNCTASFVSPQGLVVTNHHCAYGAIQLNSTPEKNLIKNGFYAATHQDELSAGNAKVFVLDEIIDVTKDVQQAIQNAKTGLERANLFDQFEKELISKCETDGYRCRLYSFFDGITYRLFKNLELKDIRLVYAPPSSIGAYGGEVDNFMWPRHTGDFSFYRAYVNKDGKPAAYHKDNVPYKPKHWLKFTDKPLAEGDFVMIAGYPGSTNRYALSDEFTNVVEWLYPTTSKHYQNMIALVDNAAKNSPDIDVKYASIKHRWGNRSKNYNGQLEGFKRIDAISIKAREEANVLNWLKQQGDKGKAALDAHHRLQELNQKVRENQARDLILKESVGALTSSAISLYRLSIEKEKPNSEREKGYQERDIASIESNLKQMERRYEASMDKQLQRYWLQEYLKLPAQQRIAAIDKWLGGNTDQDIEKALERLSQSELKIAENRLKWLTADKATFEKSDDPAIQYAVAIMPTLLELEKETKAIKGENLVLRPLYLQAVIDYQKTIGKAIYPDANSSLRLTFGNVVGYTKLNGEVQTPFTKVEEITAKDTGKEPFDAPKALLNAITEKRYAGYQDEKLNSVPVNFLSNLDITGGNSGSPMLDSEGKLIGLAFDGNWESVSSKAIFDEKMTRVIGVDQRYIRWIMQEIYPALPLLQEMNLK